MAKDEKSENASAPACDGSALTGALIHYDREPIEPPSVRDLATVLRSEFEITE